MRLSIIICTLLTGFHFCLSASVADDAKPMQDLKVNFKQFDGNWKVVGLESDGIKAPAEALKGMHWSFKGSQVEFADPGEKLGNKTAIRIDSSKSPKQIDLVGVEGKLKGKTIHGIFKFEKDRLVICVSDPEAAKIGRPKEFKTEANSGLGIITLERVKE